MFSASRIYALDIETDNTPCQTVCETYAQQGQDTCHGHGLDPARTFITEAALSLPKNLHDGGIVFAGAENDILTSLVNCIQQLPPGLITTWNGACFDLPFLSDRAAKLGIGLGLTLTPDEGIEGKYGPLLGHTSGYTGVWKAATAYHQHLDIAYAYKHYAQTHNLPWGLKPVAQHQGIPMIELDRSRLHTYTADQRAAYNLSDTNGTRLLAIQLLGA